jgi:hypothetical protein
MTDVVAWGLVGTAAVLGVIACVIFSQAVAAPLATAIIGIFL